MIDKEVKYNNLIKDKEILKYVLESLEGTNLTPSEEISFVTGIIVGINFNKKNKYDELGENPYPSVYGC